MIITELPVNESHLDLLTKLISVVPAKVSLDWKDAEHVLLGKEGVLYEAHQDEGEDNRTFMHNFFNLLTTKDAVRASTSFLLYIGQSAADPLMLEDMAVINDFYNSFNDDDLDVKWGMKVNEEGERMSLMMICTKNVNS